MIVQCSNCGAPLDVKTGERSAKCRYCDHTEAVKGMQTLHMQTPPGWTPPQQWVPPAGVKIQVQTPLTYRVPDASVRAVAATAAWIPILIVVGTLVPVGIGVFAAISSGTGGIVGLGGLDSGGNPSLGVVAIGPGPTQRVLAAATEGTVDLPTGFGQYPSTPHVVLQVVRRMMVTLVSHSTDDTTLLLQMPTGPRRYDDDGGDGHDAMLSVGLEPGRYPVWVGNRNEGVPFQLTITAFPVNEMPGPDGLVGSPGTELEFAL